MYRLHRSGGRVKSAGLGLDTLYPDEAGLYAEDPSPERAGRLRAAFREVQENPSPRLSAAFFPQERSAVRQHLQRAGLYRPFLKTDQGPPGTFLPFVTAHGAQIRPYRIVQREGVAVPEAHAVKALTADAVSRRTVDRVRELYREHRLDECAGAIGELAGHVGYDRRDAGVGRGLFFFCNASAADEPVTVPEHVCVEVERIVNELMEGAQAKAAHARALYRGGMPLSEALASAQTAEPVERPLYFQADVYLALDGAVHVDQIQLPDLGLFLTQLSPDGYAILPQVQRIVRDLRERAMEQLATLASPVYLLTRPAVLECQEDTLEQLEILALRGMAREVGHELCVGTSADVSKLPAGAQVLLLNVDPSLPECEALLQRTARGEISCTPDPFLKLLSPELTTLRRVAVRGKQLERFLQTIRAGGQMNAKSYHAFHAGIERIYRHGRHTTDILHVEVPGERTPTPTLRHSVHSFTSLYNTCSRRGFPELWIRDVPMHRENAIVHSETGPHLAAFRFFFSRA
ncbi:MAG: hypothetical protein JWM27_5026 [Gemmatimonadetes bacterium]|nr:hypothetical protein [Gemmatimonadota bacterium]